MASKPRKQLPDRGYMVVDLGLDDHVLELLRKESYTATYTPVFKNVGAKTDDAYRLQSRVTRASGAVASLRRALLEVTACLNPAWTARVFSFMYSKKEGEEQEPHQDYTSEVLLEVAKKQPGRPPASVIFAFEANTCLRFYSGCFKVKDDTKARVVNIPIGFCIIFRRDLIHNGMPYDVDHYRLHCYLTYRKVSWTPDIVTSVLLKYFTCGYCPLKMTESDRMRNHRRYCENNPKALENKKKRRLSESIPGKFVCDLCGKVYLHQLQLFSLSYRARDTR